MKIRFAIARALIALALKIAGPEAVEAMAYSKDGAFLRLNLAPDFSVMVKIGNQYFNKEN